MRKLSSEEAKKYVGGWGSYCGVCTWSTSGVTQYTAMQQAISHAGLGHVVHCCVTKSVFDAYSNDNPNLVWY